MGPCPVQVQGKFGVTGRNKIPGRQCLHSLSQQPAGPPARVEGLHSPLPEVSLLDLHFLPLLAPSLFIYSSYFVHMMEFHHDLGGLSPAFTGGRSPSWGSWPRSGGEQQSLGLSWALPALADHTEGFLNRYGPTVDHHIFIDLPSPNY